MVHFTASREAVFSAILKGLKFPQTSIGFQVAILSVLCVFTAIQTGPLLGQADPEEADCPNPLINKECTDDGIILLEPLDGSTHELHPGPEPLAAFFTYFNMSWPWIIGVASGIAVLHAVWGGILIMFYADLDEGKQKIQWAVFGMVMIALAGFILRFLNPIFYE